MASFIKTLKDASRENIIYPRTKSNAIYHLDNKIFIKDRAISIEI